MAVDPRHDPSRDLSEDERTGAGSTASPTGEVPVLSERSTLAHRAIAADTAVGDARVVHEPGLERQGRTVSRSGRRFVLVGSVLALPAIVLVLVASTWAAAIGLALLAVSVGLLVVGGGLLLSALVARWSAPHRSFV